MISNKFDVTKLSVAKPCHVPWESMTGNERVRRCDSCKLSIFNTEAMTAREIERLTREHEGRLCIRLHRRFDGTVITKDCPVGLSDYRRRVASYIAASFGAILSLFSLSFGRDNDRALLDRRKPTTKVVKIYDNAQSKLAGVLADSNGALVPGFEVRLYKGKEKKPLRTTKSGDEGEFAFLNLDPGTYRIEVPKANGFKRTIVENIVMNSDKDQVINVVLEPAQQSVTVGIYTEVPMIDTTISGPTPTRITRDMIDRMSRGWHW